MKKLFVLLIMFFALTSCEPQGTTMMRLNDTGNLPPELKGLKVYSVSLGGGNWVKVAVLNNDINSLTYSEGKTTTSAIIVNNLGNNRVINGEIITETDDIILIRKK